MAWAAYDPAGPAPRRRMLGRERALVAVVAGPGVADTPVVVDALLDLLVAAGVRRFATDRPHPLAANVGRPADLVVLVADHVARPLTADGLLAEGVAHLSVVLRDTDVVVGPLVLPGRSACLRCLDRRQQDADPHWPLLREAMAAAPPRPVDAATTRLVAGIVGLQVLAHLDGGRAAAVGTTLEVLLPEGRVRQRWWRPHPDCGCVDLPVPR